VHGGFTWHPISTYWSKRLHPFGARSQKTAIDLLSIPCFARQHGYMGDIVGVVLVLDDGTAGLAAEEARRRGWLFDLEEALYSECPRARSRTQLTTFCQCPRLQKFWWN